MWTFEHTPAGPDDRVDWDAIGRYPWVARMAGVRQEPEYHAEGDVQVHTRMVAEALARSPAWRTRPPGERHALFLSALLHDVAKPATTVLEGGRWTAPNHTTKGEPMARTLLWTGQAGDVPPFAVRERVVKLVRLHGLPLRFVDKPDPQRAVLEASQVVRLDLLADLAEADVRGRVTTNGQELLDRVDLFRAFCDENGCLGRPARFESDHHRFTYFVGRKPYDYVPYDDARFEYVVMCGLPGSGKSTYVEAHLAGLGVLSLDAIRAETGVDPGDRDEQAGVAREGRERAKALLRRGQPFVWDATSLARDQRAMLVGLLATYGARTRIVYCEAPLAEMLRRNRQRTGHRRVPDGAITRMVERIDIPSPVEAHRVEYVVGTDGELSGEA